MKAEIISIGTEILLGEITDTNASFLAGQLPLLGIELHWVSQVDDNQAKLVEVMSRAWQRSDLVITTGGLGPTGDDLTREAIAETLDEKLEIDQILAEELRQFFSRRNVEMPASNYKQTTLIPSATALRNSQGTAPGWWVERDGHILIAMPGPPREMQHMWNSDVFLRLKQKTPGEIIVSKTFKTFGLGEAGVGDLVESLFSSTNPVLGVYAKLDGIHLRLAAKASSEAQAWELIAKTEEQIRMALNGYIWGVNDETLEVLVAKLMMEKGLSLVTMESCTGGLLACSFTDVAGSSAFFKGGLIADSGEAKAACGLAPELIARHGAASMEMAQAMAETVRRRLGASIGLSTAGVAGSEEVAARPAETVYIGISSDRGNQAVGRNYPGGRIQVKRRITSAAIFELRKWLISLD